MLGIILTAFFVWEPALAEGRLRRLLSLALVVIAVLGFVQLLVLAADLTSSSPLRSFGALDEAISTDAGMAFLARLGLAAAMWIIVFRYQHANGEVFRTAVTVAGVGLLATWAFAGHSGALRWPDVGVVADIVHHGAAAGWIAGLLIVALIAAPLPAPSVIGRFSRAATVYIALVVVTGLIQSTRLVGSPTNLFAADHGKYLVAKVAILAIALAIAAVNRRRLGDELATAALRRAMLIEFALGLLIVGITAAMVVAPPATS